MVVRRSMWALVRGARLRGTFTAALAAVAVFSSVPSCAPGELNLATGNSEPGSGGVTSNGGSPEDPHEPNGMGASAPHPDSPDDPKFVQYSCVVREDCEFFICDPGDPGCPSCDSGDDCHPLFPHCDSFLDVCVECIDDHDCEEQFGPAFDQCSAGRCVQCQRDSHCDNGRDCDHGWCGHCEDDRDCDSDFYCYRDHCIPEPD